MHKEVHQATSCLASLGVTGKEGADPQLSSVKSASHSEPIFQLLQLFTLSLHQDMMLQQIPQLKLILAKYASYGFFFLETEANNDQEFNTSPELTSFDDVTRVIKLKDLSKLVKDINIDITELDSPEDDQPFMVENDEDEEVHVEPNAKAEDTLLEKAQAEELCTRLNLHFQMLNNSLSYWLQRADNLKLEVKVRLLALPGQVSSINVAQAIESASQKTSDNSVPSAG
ncbi:hypothetical protein Tco_0462560 [Tanacetum coccineum]